MKKAILLVAVVFAFVGCPAKNADVTVASMSLEEKPPIVRVSFSMIELDMARFYIDEGELSAIKADDKKFSSGESADKNWQTVFETKAGEFRIVSCFGRQSLDPKAYASNQAGLTLRCDMMQLPNGQWIQAFPGPFRIKHVLENGGDVYLLCDHDVFKVVSPEKMIVVISLGTRPSIDYKSSMPAGQLAGDYWQVFKSDASDFGGLLEYSGSWSFHTYPGGYLTAVEQVEGGQRDSQFILVLRNNKKILFDKEKGGFTDL